MTIMVTGGAGYIGSHMVLNLLSNNENVVVLDNLSTGRRFLTPEKIPFIEGDIGDSQLIAETIREFGVTSIIHFAGSIIVPESVSDPLKYYLNNTVKSRALIEQAVKNNVKHFIFSSTAAVYGIPEINPVTENSPLNPISPYGASKMMTEMMLKDVANAHNITFASLRYFNVAGADPEARAGQSTPDATHLIKVACQAALGQRLDVKIFGTDYDTPDGTGVRDYIHVSDLANAHYLTLDYLRNGGESKIMNCGYGHGYSVREVLETMRKISGVDFPVKETARRPGDPAELVADAAALKQILNWSPQFNDLSLIILHALAWEKKLAIQNSNPANNKEHSTKP